MRHIEVFHAVYVTGSVSGAARALNVAQPTVSKTLKHTEDQIGFLLFERISGRLIPTEKGVKLFAKIEPIFENLVQLDRYTSMLANTRTGLLRIAMTPAFALQIVPQAITEFSKANPRVTIEVETLHANQLITALIDNAIDLGIVFDAPKFPGVSSEKLCATELVCLAPSGSALEHLSEVSLKDLQAFTLISLHQKSVLGQILNRKLEAAFQRPADTHIVVDTYHIAKRLVRYGAGIAIIDAVTAFSGDTSGLKVLRLNPVININVDVVSRLNAPSAKFKSDFLDKLQASITAFQAKPEYEKLINSS